MLPAHLVRSPRTAPRQAAPTLDPLPPLTLAAPRGAKPERCTMQHWRFSASLLFLWAAACANPRPLEGALNEFAFLEGTWAKTTSTSTTEEVWTLNHGWSLRGVGRTLHGTSEVSREIMSIEPRGERFVYVAQVPGQGPVEFALQDRGSEWARFENPEHDFPQRIEYRRSGKRLRAEISGQLEGRTWREVFEYSRVNGR